MTGFLLHLGWLTLAMSGIILLILLFYGMFGKRFTAKSRYLVWAVIVLSLCVGTLLFKLPAVFTVEIPLPSPEPVMFDETAESSAESEALTYLPDANAVIPVMPTTPETDKQVDTIRPHNPPETIPQQILPLQPEIPEKEPVQINLPALLFGIWTFGAAVYATVGLTVYIRMTHKYTRAKKLCDRETEEVFHSLCRKYHINRKPGLYQCQAVGSPVLYGYIKPTILLPDIPLSENALVGVLAHELIHYRRGDIWMKLFCLLAESLYWFNPLVYLAAFRCNAEMELSCDEAVLAGMTEKVRQSYGNVMLDIVKHSSRKRSTLTTQFNPHKTAVRERILNILDATKKNRGRGIILAALILCLSAGTVMGCVIKYDEQDQRPDSLYTVEAGVTVVDSLALEQVDTASITELIIGQDVEQIDFAYLNTLPALQKVTVDDLNEHYRSISNEADDNMVISLHTQEILYFSADHFLDLSEAPTLTDYYPAKESIRLYIRGCVMNVWFDPDAYWFLTSIEYNGVTKEIDHVMQITGYIGLGVFPMDGGVTVTYRYTGWSSAFFFKDGKLFEFNPIQDHSGSYGVSLNGDGIQFTPGENGEIFYTRVTRPMVSINTDDWYVNFLYSPDQFWMEEGVFSIADDKFIFTPIQTYTIADYFAVRETTIEKWFDDLKSKGQNNGFETLEALLASNAPTTDTSAFITVEEIPGLPQAPDTAWQIYDPMLSPIYYFYNKGLTYYCYYNHNGEYYQKNTLHLPEGYDNGEIFYISGTGGSASMYINVKTDQGYLRYYSMVSHGPDEVLSVTKLTDEEVEQMKEWMAAEQINFSPISYQSLSDFLTDEQIAIYETADLLYPLFNGNADSVNILPNQTGFTDRSKQTSCDVNGYRYLSAEGEYRDFETFREFCLTAFTEEAFDALNTLTDNNGEFQSFIEHDGRLYYINAAKGSAFGYAPKQYPDTYELISRTDHEIRFRIVGYYQDSGGTDPIYTVSKYSFPVTMVLDDDGWRFSRFADPAHSDMDWYLREEVLTSYFGKNSMEELMELSVIDQSEELSLGDLFEKTGYSPTQYSVIDLDGDARHEMVFWLAYGPNHENAYAGFLILHGEESNVYAHQKPFRAFYELKTDGTFCFSGGVSDNGIGKFQFDGPKMVLTLLAHCKSDESDVAYYIGNEAVSKEDYDTYNTEQTQKPNAEWQIIPREP